MGIAEKLSQIAENEQKVYDAGFTAGQAQGGLDEYYDIFWDIYQQNGNRASYEYAFAGHGWTDELFKPKYDMFPTTISQMFTGCKMTDVRKLLIDAGVVLDTSNTLAVSYLAQNSGITTLPVLDLRKVNNLSYFLLGNSQLHTIEKIILNENGTTTFSNYTFMNNTALQEVRFDGVIGQSLTIATSPLLSTDTVQSIIDHLKDLTGGAAQTLTLHADVGAKLTEAQKAAVTAKNWQLVY